MTAVISANSELVKLAKLVKNSITFFTSFLYLVYHVIAWLSIEK